MSSNSENIKFVLCPGSMPGSEFESLYVKIYECWYSVWSQTFKELDVQKTLHSDAFTRQDYVGALFFKDSCFALSFFRWADAGRPEFAADSYFSNWSRDHLKAIGSRGDRIIICSNFTVHPIARGKTLGFSSKELLTGISIETFLNSGADGMTGALRVDRGVSSSCERWGGYVIERGVACEYGEKNTDLIGFFKDYILSQPPQELKGMVQEIWKNRLVIPRLDVTDSIFKNPNSQISRVS